MYAISYTLSREYQEAGNQYLWLLFTSEDRICANLLVQEQSTNMPVSHVHVMKQIELWWHHNAKSEKTVLGESGEMGNLCLF